MHCTVVSWVLETVEQWSGFGALWQTTKTPCMRLRGINKVYLPPRRQGNYFSRHYVTNTPMITWLDRSSPICLSPILDPDRVETLTWPLLCYSVESSSSFKPQLNNAANKQPNTPRCSAEEELLSDLSRFQLVMSGSLIINYKRQLQRQLQRRWSRLYISLRSLTQMGLLRVSLRKH